MHHLQPSHLGVIAAVGLTALGASWLAVELAIRFARRASLADRRHLERGGGPAFRALPRIGGIGTLIAGAATTAITAHLTDGLEASGEVLALGGIAVAVGLVGLVDDVRSLHGTSKLIALIVAGSLAWLCGQRLEHLPATRLPLPLPLAAAVTVCWLTVVPTAVNIVDGLDGLASGLAVIGCVAIGVAGLAVGDPTVAAVAGIAVAAIVGFWIHNRHPARIFMGDGGAMFLGFVLAVLGLRVLAASTDVTPVALTLAGLAWPLGELAITVVRRLGGGLMRPDARHLHHALLARLGHLQAVRTIHLLALAPLVVVTLSILATQLGPTEVGASVATATPGIGDGSPAAESVLP
jgi:UDP-GlcNAc:undecaprenyl-phosphate GlcNAc-1-phosphate transferase